MVETSIQNLQIDFTPNIGRRHATSLPKHWFEQIAIEIWKKWKTRTVTRKEFAVINGVITIQHNTSLIGYFKEKKGQADVPFLTDLLHAWAHTVSA